MLNQSLLDKKTSLSNGITAGAKDAVSTAKPKAKGGQRKVQRRSKKEELLSSPGPTAVVVPAVVVPANEVANSKGVKPKAPSKRGARPAIANNNTSTAAKKNAK